jgi:hypothetical protein
MRTCLQNREKYIVYLISWRLWLISYACALFGVSRCHKLHSHSCRRWYMELSAIWWRYLPEVFNFIYLPYHYIFMLISLAGYQDMSENLCKAVCSSAFSFNSLLWFCWMNQTLEVSLYLFNSAFFTRRSIFCYFLRDLWEEHPFCFLFWNILVKDCRLIWSREGWMWLAKTYAVDKTFQKPREKRVQLRSIIILFSEAYQQLDTIAILVN